MKHIKFKIVFICLFACISLQSHTKDTLTEGAYLYQKLCSLCHGRNGMGAGALPAVIKEYPETNLLQKTKNDTHEKVFAIISDGTKSKDGVVYMPPWKETLTNQEMSSLTNFVVHLREDSDSAIKILQNHAEDMEPNKRHGLIIYRSYCQGCHGISGAGDGRLAKFITDPSPSNLTTSKATDEFLRKIISEGGASVGRSSRMPIWNKELSNQDIESVILYIKGLRINTKNKTVSVSAGNKNEALDI